jgi:hypothetical protein
MIKRSRVLRPRTLEAPQRIFRVVEAPPSLAAYAVLVKVLSRRPRTNVRARWGLRKASVRELATAAERAVDKHSEDDDGNGAKDGNDANDRVLADLGLRGAGYGGGGAIGFGAIGIGDGVDGEAGYYSGGKFA